MAPSHAVYIQREPNAPRLRYMLVNVCTTITEYYARVVLSKRMVLSVWGASFFFFLNPVLYTAHVPETQ
jgi:hypothetical protein